MKFILFSDKKQRAEIEDPTPLTDQQESLTESRTGDSSRELESQLQQLPGSSASEPESQPSQLPSGYSTSESGLPYQQLSGCGCDPGVMDRQSLNDYEKKCVLKDKWVPPVNYSYPKNKMNRRYNPDWEKKYPWIRYSPSQDGIFCSACFCFSYHTQAYPEFVIKPFDDWKNACGGERGSLNRHDKAETHLCAMVKAQDYLQVCDQQKKSITQHISQAYAQKIENNRKSLLSILDVIISLAKRGVPLRGKWNKAKHEEDSNFNFFCEMEGSR